MLDSKARLLYLQELFEPEVRRAIPQDCLQEPCKGSECDESQASIET